MSNTYQLGLPMVQAAQAQKHVTVNECLARLDGLTQINVVSQSFSSPPTQAIDGETYIVAPLANGPWTGEEGNLAISVNGGWSFVSPRLGWRAWAEDYRVHMVFDGQAWRPGALAVTENGAMSGFGIWEFDHEIQPGPSSATSIPIPPMTCLFAVTARVIDPITGTSLTSWELGVAGSTNRYGSGLSLGVNSYAQGLTGTPITYYTAEPLVLTPDSGDFIGGTVRLAMHLAQFEPPRAV